MSDQLPETHRCAKMMYRKWTNTQCSRKGYVFEDGKWWCVQHAPSMVKQRSDRSYAQYKEKSHAKYDLQAKENILLERVIEDRIDRYFDLINDVLEARARKKALEDVKP